MISLNINHFYLPMIITWYLWISITSIYLWLLHDIFEYQSLLFTYDYLNNKLPSSFDGKFPKNRDVLNYKDTRQSDNLFVPNFSSKYAQKLPAYHLPKLWNKWIRLLPDSNKRYSIKNSIKSQILQTYQEDVKCNNVKCSDCYAQWLDWSFTSLIYTWFFHFTLWRIHLVLIRCHYDGT